MTILDAIKSGRPIRRKPGALGVGPWIVIGDMWRGGSSHTPWLRIDNGDEITLARHDYLAEDWEVMQ